MSYPLNSCLSGRSYVHHFPGQRNTFQRPGFWVAYFRSFSHDRHSPGRDTTAQACRFSCFFCAAYGLLLTQTRTQCSNSVCKAIAMLANPAKICKRSALGSGDIRTLIMESCQSVQMGRSTLLALSFVGRYTKQKSV